MRRGLLALALAGAALTAAAQGGGVAAAPAGRQAAGAGTVVTLRVHHFLPASSTTHAQLLVPWCERLARDSGGRLQCRIYPAMQLGGTPAQLYDQARDGVADVVWTLPGYTAGRFPLTEVFELPFMTRGAEGASRALWRFWQADAPGEFAGVRPLALHVHDEGVLHLRERPLTRLEDFKGRKLRAPTRQTNRLLAALGAVPVAMPATALGDALAKGVIDGAVIPWEVVPALKVHELVRFHTETDPARPALYTAVFLLAMNPRTYDALPADLQAIVDRHSGEALSAAAGKLWDASRAAARAQAVARGNRIDVVPAAELARWEAAGQKVSAAWVADMNQRGLDGARLLADAQALIRANATPGAR